MSIEYGVDTKVYLDAPCNLFKIGHNPLQLLLGYHALLWGRTVRCAKSRLFSTTGSHGSQGPEFCTLQTLLVHRGYFFLV